MESTVSADSSEFVQSGMPGMCAAVVSGSFRPLLVRTATTVASGWMTPSASSCGSTATDRAEEVSA